MMDFMSGKIEPRDAEIGDLTAGERSPALGSEPLLSSLLVLGSVFMWSRDVRGRNESAALPHSAAEVSDTAGGRGWESSPGAFPPAVWENGRRELQVLNDSQLMLCRASPVGTRRTVLLRAHVIPLKALAASFPFPDFSFGTSKVRTVTTQIWG